ncbi:hypothetical protein NTHI1209_00682 [Haemophilus influenzae]|uniref:Uncharacterized protein n=1 Tax=Haemophilus influenzae TaxID=727 RepID=A0A158SW35_HAEIF|nr:hypothetical protein NTHI1209_00682 [Haemophilus influenzae]
MRGKVPEGRKNVLETIYVEIEHLPPSAFGSSPHKWVEPRLEVLK